MKQRNIYPILIVLLLFTTVGNAQIIRDSPLFLEYITINNAEKRLEEFKDSDSDLLLKLNQLEVINQSRARYNVPPVKLDILASRVANRMSVEAAKGGYISHWNENGEKPYHRYAFAGGVDHVSENASGESFTGSYSMNDITKAKMMLKFHNLFMAEKAPANGHKLNIIDATHNYVGIGLYLDKNEFRYYEEFIDRYFTFKEPPVDIKRDESFTIIVSTEQGYFISYLSAYYEKEVQKKSVNWLRNSGSYQDYTNVIAYEISPWDISSYRSGSTYNIPLKFSKPGLYYIQIFQDTKEYTGGGRYTTDGKIQGSGLVIRVK